VIALLRAEFVNTWLLARDLEAIAARSGDADVAQLCALVRENYGYPVDSVLITPDLRVVGHVNVNEAAAREASLYLSFLRRGLAAARGEELAEAPEEPEVHAESDYLGRTLVLTPDEPLGTLLDVVRRGGFGEPNMKFFMIDATAFTDGGTLEISVRVGGANASGKFELCAAVEGGMSPVQTLAKVGPGETATLTHAFDAGALFGLATMAGAGSVEGDTNAFLATVTVRD
jgi:hypothetical protein